MKVKINVMGTPTFFIDNQPVVFPTQKIAALGYYLFLERETNRLKLATLFWGEKDEAAAAGNLRNAIYLLKKIIPEELIAIDRRSLQIHPDADISLDIDALDRLEHCSPDEVDKLNLEFMDGFSVPGCEEFDTWLRQKRFDFSEKFENNIRLRIQSQKQHKKWDDVAHCLKLLIKKDSFDEKNYLQLMQLYASTGRTSKAFKLFSTLKQILNQELGASPGQEIMELHHQLLTLRREKNKESEETSGFPFFGREAEIKDILSYLQQHRDNKVTCINIFGPAGIGKSALINHLLPKLSRTRALWCRGHEISEKYAYSPWNGFFRDISPDIKSEKLGDPLKIHILKTHFPSFEVEYNLSPTTDFSPLLQQHNPVRLGELLAEIMRLISASQGQLIILEDLQWFDTSSLEMLQSFLLSRPGNLVLIALYRTGDGGGRQAFFDYLAHKEAIRVKKINLIPFNKEETKAFCELSLKRSLKEEEVDPIFQETEGVPLFISELLNLLQEGKSIRALPNRLAGIIENRIQSLSPYQKSILEYLSAFSSEVFYNDFLALFEKDRVQLAEDIEHLCRKNFIRERISDSDNLKLCFTHDRIKSYVYSQISEFRKRALHGKIAAIFEKNSQRIVWDKTLENETITHYHKAANEPGALIFQLRRLRRHVIINHELFPIIEDSDLLLCGLPFSTQSMTEARLNEAESVLAEIKSRYPDSDEMQKCTALYQEIKGSYDIYFGNYADGRHAVEQALKYAETKQHAEMKMRCLLQLSFIGIQTEERALISQSSKKLCAFACENGSDLFTAVALRFLGVHMQIEGRDDLAERLFLKSIERLKRLSKSGERYTLNILAAENYIGEIYHRRGMLETAMGYFEDCLAKCFDKNLFWGRALFHSNAAYVALSMKAFALAESHVDEAIRLFETTPSGRKSSIAYSIKAYLEGRKGKTASALKYLMDGEALCNPIQKKSWMALQFWVKAELLRMPSFSHIKQMPLLLKKEASHYSEASEKLFRSIHALGDDRS